jgi:hypothetical protein
LTARNQQKDAKKQQVKKNTAFAFFLDTFLCNGHKLVQSSALNRLRISAVSF